MAGCLINCDQIGYQHSMHMRLCAYVDTLLLSYILKVAMNFTDSNNFPINRGDRSSTSSAPFDTDPEALSVPWLVTAVLIEPVVPSFQHRLALSRLR